MRLKQAALTVHLVGQRDTIPPQAAESLSSSYSKFSLICPRLHSRFGEYLISVVISFAVSMVFDNILEALVTSFIPRLSEWPWQ